MNNGMYPLFFFLVFLTYAKEPYVFTYLLFVSCFIDFLCYPFQGINIILIIILYVINHSLKKCYKKKQAVIRTMINTSIYFFILNLFTKNFSLLIYFTQIIWNVLFTLSLFDKKRIEIKKKQLSK